MAIPKTAKLSEADKQIAEMKAPSVLLDAGSEDTGPVQIRVIQCLNDFVAILQTTTKSNIAIPDASKYKNEGIVVGVGPGVSDGAGGRLPLSVAVGDVVLFGEKNIIAVLESDSPPYVGKRVIIVSERNIICKLPRKVEFEYAEV